MTEEEIRRGLDLTYKNAFRLWEEANGLFIFERYSRAYSLFQLASEELGKALMIYHALLDFYNGVNINEDYFEERKFRDHKTKIKNVILIQIQVFSYMAEKLENGQYKEILDSLVEQYDKTKELNVKKNQSLYVGIEKNEFVFPDDVITKDMANELAVLSAISIEGIKPMIQQPKDILQKVAAGLLEKIKETEIEAT
jgi:AbiV family abortive infection protein